MTEAVFAAEPIKAVDCGSSRNHIVIAAYYQI